MVKLEIQTSVLAPSSPPYVLPKIPLLLLLLLVLRPRLSLDSIEWFRSGTNSDSTVGKVPRDLELWQYLYELIGVLIEAKVVVLVVLQRMFSSETNSLSFF